MHNQQQITAERPGERVAELLSEQRDLYRRLLRLADQQRGLITGNEPEQLLAVLAERQQLIDRLTATGRELKPLQATWRQVRDSLTDEQAGCIDALVTEVNALLSEILKKDEADTALLSARKSETGRAMGVLQTGRQAGAAYAASVGQGSASGAGMDWASA